MEKNLELLPNIDKQKDNLHIKHKEKYSLKSLSSTKMKNERGMTLLIFGTFLSFALAIIFLLSYIIVSIIFLVNNDAKAWFIDQIGYLIWFIFMILFFIRTISIIALKSPVSLGYIIFAFFMTVITAIPLIIGYIWDHESNIKSQKPNITKKD